MKTRPTLNVLISSTRQWNPGDEFILMGVRRLLESVLGPRLHYILWNRNPDLFLDRWANPRLRPTLLTNSAVEPALDVMDLVVLAGSPEWSGPPLERVYRELLRYPHVPLLTLGAGGAGPGFVLSEMEREVYLRPNSLIVCRNPMLAAEVNDQLGTPKARLLPCPALFCSPETTPRSADSFASVRPALGVQGDTVDNQACPKSLVDRFKAFLSDDPEASRFGYVAHYIEEFLRYSRLGRSRDIFYSYEPFDYVAYYRNGVRLLITSRLHGAIASLSCGTPASVIEFGSHRVSDAVQPFEGLLPSLDFEESLNRCRDLTPQECASRSVEIMAFKERTFRVYQDVLTTFLGDADRLGSDRLRGGGRGEALLPLPTDP
jgi:Polysaccharide pyruvyl transferase